MPLPRVLIGKAAWPWRRCARRWSSGRTVARCRRGGLQAAPEKRDRPRDGRLVAIAEIVEGGHRFGDAAAGPQREGVETALPQVIQLVAQDVADRAQFAGVAVFFAQQARGRIATTVAELREVDGDQ